MTVRARWAQRARASAVAALAPGAGGGLLLPALLSGSTLAAAAATASAAGTCTTGENCAGLTVSPSAAQAGDAVRFVFSLSDLAAKADDGGKTVGIRSVQLTAPAGFVVESAVAPGSATVATTPGTATFDGLAVPVGGTATLTVTAAVPCGEAAGATTQWGFAGQDASPFTAKGNEDNFTLDSASTAALTGSIAGECSLAFTAGEPAGTTVATPLTAGFDSHGGPVQVEVLSSTGLPVTGFEGAVRVGLAAGPAGATLGGPTTEQASSAPGGASVASFSDLTLSEAGPGYQLEATGKNLRTGSSGYLSIYQTITACSGSACANSSSSPGVRANLETASVGAGRRGALADMFRLHRAVRRGGGSCEAHARGRRDDLLHGAPAALLAPRERSLHRVSARDQGRPGPAHGPQHRRPDLPGLTSAVPAGGPRSGPRRSPGPAPRPRQLRA